LDADEHVLALARDRNPTVHAGHDFRDVPIS
jgi:hypothetical protein